MLGYDVRGHWLGRVFALAWLLMLVFPITAALSGEEGFGPYPLVAVGALLAFAVVYTWYWLRVLAVQSRVGYRIAMAGMLVIIAASLLAAGGRGHADISYMLIYVSVAAAFWNQWKAGVAWSVGMGLLVIAIAELFNPGQLPDFNPVILVTLIGLGMVGVRQMIVTIDRLKTAQDELARMAVGEERLRFSRDLHDLLGHSLSVIVLKSEVAKTMVGRDPERAEAEIADIERVARDSLRDVRAAVAGYRQTNLNTELSGAREMLESAGIAMRWEEKAGELPADAQTVLAWAVREGATNVLRHSHARECMVRLSRENGSAVLEMLDDGSGQTAEAPAPGNGLRGLSERVAALGGEMHAEPLVGKGFRLAVTVPVAG